MQLHSKGILSNDTRISSNVQFFRWADDDGSTSGVFVTAQNMFVDPSSAVSWTLDQNWTTNQVRTLDSAIIGLYQNAQTNQILFAETAAVTRVVEHFLVAPSADDSTVKLNIAWCENDYQLDIALEEDREAYKRIIDRAAEMGKLRWRALYLFILVCADVGCSSIIKVGFLYNFSFSFLPPPLFCEGIDHILFAPRNSDVSSQSNNTDPWGWEQILWFGYACPRPILQCACFLLFPSFT